MGAEGRHLAGKDLLGQCHKLLRGGLIPRLDGGAAGDGVQHPLGVLVQRVPAALEQAVGDFHQQILGVLRLYVRRHSAQQHGAAAKVGHIQPGVFQQGLIFQQRLLFLCGKVDGGGLQQQLAGHVAVVRGQLFVQLTLVGGVLIDQTQLVSPLRQNIGAENLAHVPQRLFPLRHIKA